MPINFTEQFQKATGFTRMLEILDTEPEVKDRPGAIEVGTLSGGLISKMCISITKKLNLVLQNINASIYSGSTVALVGPSGACKSTFVSDSASTMWFRLSEDRRH